MEPFWVVEKLRKDDEGRAVVLVGIVGPVVVELERALEDVEGEDVVELAVGVWRIPRVHPRHRGAIARLLCIVCGRIPMFRISLRDARKECLTCSSQHSLAVLRQARFWL